VNENILMEEMNDRKKKINKSKIIECDLGKCDYYNNV
jgi:hypothetical protein